MRSKDPRATDKTKSDRSKTKSTSETRKSKPRPAFTKQQEMLMKAGIRPGSEKFGEVKMKPAPKFMKKFNLGGEAATSVGRATVVKSQREAQRKKLDDMMNRLYGPSNKPKPKPKPKKPLKKVLGDKIKPRLKKKPLKKRLKGNQESIMPIVIEPKKKPPTRRKEKMAKSPKTKSARAMELARKRKKSGRLTKDDIERAMKKKRGGSIKKKSVKKKK